MCHESPCPMTWNPLRACDSLRLYDVNRLIDFQTTRINWKINALGLTSVPTNCLLLPTNSINFTTAGSIHHITCHSTTTTITLLLLWLFDIRIAMNERTNSRVLPALDESESDQYPTRKQQQQQQQRKSEYRKSHSIESRQPLLIAQESSPRRHRPAPPIPRDDDQPHFYANVEPPTKKNVRFSKRTQSLDYLSEFLPSDNNNNSPVARKIKQNNKLLKSPNNKKTNKKKMSQEYSSSGEELCTDEFLLLNYNKSPASITDANKNKTVTMTSSRQITELKRAPSSASSPNLVFDPASNTARLVYGEQSNKSVRVQQQQQQQRKMYLNETSIWKNICWETKTLTVLTPRTGVFVIVDQIPFSNCCQKLRKKNKKYFARSHPNCHHSF